MAKKNLKFFVSLITVICFACYSCILPGIALADGPPEKIATLKKNERAPFAGTLFSTTAAAKLLIDLEYNEETCLLEKQRELSLLRAELQLKLDLKTAEFDSLKLRHSEILVIKNDQLKFLQDQIKPSAWYESGEFWFVVGVVGGIALTMGAGYALGQIDN